MSKKPDETDPAGGNVKDSAQQIWLAGLGAFAKAQEEGTKVFEALVKEGLSMQRKSQAAAEEKLSEATRKMASMASGVAGAAGAAGGRSSGPWDKLENIFEDRVARALKKLGAPSADDLQALMRRVDELSQQVAELSPAANRKTARKPPTAAAPADQASD